MVMQAPRDARLEAALRDAVPPDRQAVMAALADVPDPEIPAVSIVELGMIGEVEVGERGIRVELLPTFVGCPALEVIRDAVQQRLGELGTPVHVEVSFATPWTSDRISREGREKLRESGFAPPQPRDTSPTLIQLNTGAFRCPYCGSTDTRLENIFGPTPCRSIRYCADCRQPFEQFKTI